MPSKKISAPKAGALQPVCAPLVCERVAEEAWLCSEELSSEEEWDEEAEAAAQQAQEQEYIIEID